MIRSGAMMPHNEGEWMVDGTLHALLDWDEEVEYQGVRASPRDVAAWLADQHRLGCSSCGRY